MPTKYPIICRSNDQIECLKQKIDRLQRKIVLKAEEVDRITEENRMNEERYKFYRRMICDIDMETLFTPKRSCNLITMMVRS